ncbi:MAG: FIG01130075: hypothetical protein, partial [uncultured Nocardioidaceae bacterium]
ELVRRPDRARRGRAPGRAAPVRHAHGLGARAWRSRVRPGPLPGDGGAAHGSAGRCGPRGRRPGPALPAGPRLVDAGVSRAQPSASVVVHHGAREAVEHPGGRGARPAAGRPRAVRVAAAPQLRRRRARGDSPAPGPHGVGHRADLHGAQRCAAAGADQDRECRSRHRGSGV